MSYSQELEKILGNSDETGNKYFTIDDATRKITPPKDFTYLGVESDSNSKRIWFECPRFVGDNLDLTQFNVYINYQNANGDKDRWHAEDVTVEGDKIHFSWKLSRKVLKYKGTVKFIVCALETDAEGEKDPEWNTTLCTGTVLEGLEVENPEPPEEEYDLINQLLSITKNSITEVENISAQTKADIEASRLQALSDVESTQDKAVEAVESAKEGVLEYIGTGIDKTLSKEGVAAEAKETGDRLKTKGSVILNEASGNLIALADSSEAEFRGMKIFGKTKQFSTTGKNFFVEDVNKWSVYAFNNNNRYGFELPSGLTNITLSAKLKYGYEAKSITLTFVLVNDDGTYSQKNTLLFNGDVTTQVLLEENKKYIVLCLSSSYKETVAGLVETYYWQFESGTTATEYEPFTGGIPSPNPNYPQALESVGDSGSVEQVVCGKNLLDVSSLYGKTNTQNGGTISCNDKGEFSLSGTPTAICILQLELALLPVGIYTMSIHGTSSNFAYGITFRDENNAVIGNLAVTSENKVRSFNIADYPGCVKIYHEFKRAKNDAEMSGLVTCQLEAGAITNPVYEPFKTSQSLTIPTPNGLPGVPVSSDGNYTDENGQQWICDEVDFERGVLVQRVYKYVCTGNEAWKLNTVASETYNRYDGQVANIPLPIGNSSKATKCMCTHSDSKGSTSLNTQNCWVTNLDDKVGIRMTSLITPIEDFVQMLKNNYASGTPVVYSYPLATPIETPLSAEEIEAYRSLHTNYPVTTIYNNEGAHTEVEYVADTKNYIDNKFAALEAKMLSVTK